MSQYHLNCLLHFLLISVGSVLISHFHSHFLSELRQHPSEEPPHVLRLMNISNRQWGQVLLRLSVISVIQSS